MLTSLTIEYLNKCNLNCAHCAVNASPEATNKAGLEDAKNWITIAKDYGAKDIYLCGGEPFLVFDELCELARHAKSLGLTFTTYSNTFWALTIESARKHLLSLQKNGLTCLHLSFDCFHLKEGVPLQNFLNAASVANDTKLKLVVNVIQTKRKEISYNFIKKTFRNYKIHFQFGPLRPLGRASNLDRRIFIKEKRNNYRKGCRSYASPLISPKGEVFACCGAYHLANSVNPLSLGNAYNVSFSKIIEKFCNLKLLHLIATFGPHFVYELISSEKKMAISDSLYTCEFCCSLLNSEENIGIINKKLKNPDVDLRIKLELAELSYENMHNLRTPRFNSQLIGFCRYNFPTLWRFISKGAKIMLRHK